MPIVWKRLVGGVREMCDVCNTTIFNNHRTCHKCGFVKCIDCCTEQRPSNEWLQCQNSGSHKEECLTLAQFHPDTSLQEFNERIHQVCEELEIQHNCKKTKKQQYCDETKSETLNTATSNSNRDPNVKMFLERYPIEQITLEIF